MRGFTTITHPSGYRPDEVAGQGTVHMHCIGHAPAQYLRSGDLVPRNSPLLEDLRVQCPTVTLPEDESSRCSTDS